ncbi:MAG: hypothetical protein KA954_01240 [Chitinophagales bacterium]|nr:hypothetical protein [Chitinophagales bacterium]MBP9845843.1 hypothetical protein [Saprospiraceae bacterium]
MLKKDIIKKIATLLKIEESALTTAIADDKEVDLEISDDLHILTQPELEARDIAQKNEGIKTGKEIGAKEVRTAAGLDESVGKDAKKIAEAIATKAVADAKVPANEKITELTKQNELLTTKLSEKETEIETAKKQVNQIGIDRKILTAMPKNRLGIFEDDEMLDVIKSKHIKEVDGAEVVVGKDGEVIRDPKTTKPVDLKTGLLTIFTERKWLDTEGGGGAGGGRGKGDEGGGKPGIFTKKSEVIAHYESQGKSLNGEASTEIVAAIAKAAKDNAEFDMNG